MSHSGSKRVLIAGVSTRAAAESAARAGFEVTAIDAFLDLDQHPGVRALSPPDRFSVHDAARMACDIASDAVVYVSGFENHPAAVTLLSTAGWLWGNPPTVLHRVRNPVDVSRVFGDAGHMVPRLWTPSTRGTGGQRWLVKPRARGGGHLVRPWNEGSAVPRSCYVQEFIDGTAGSIVFVAARRQAVTLGVSRQLIGENAFGASGYQYCGSILSAVPDSLLAAAESLAATAARSFDLIGVNGIDFVARGSVPYPVEVNPRWCASMELVERAYGCSIFGAHSNACSRGVLPEFDFSARTGGDAFGKAVVFARRDVTLGDTRPWPEGGGAAFIRDVPRPGQRIRAGHPVCTVFARERDAEACHTALVERAGRVYARLNEWERAAVGRPSSPGGSA